MFFFRSRFLIFSGLLIWLFIFGPLRPYLNAIGRTSSPQMVLVLGGDVDREHVGAILANGLSLPLVVSGGSNREHADWLLAKAGIPKTQFYLDYRAKDTLGNFTSLVDEISKKNIQHILLVTSEDHMLRAMIVGQVISGSRGIRLTGLSVACAPNCIEESWRKRVFDTTRALFWVISGKDLKNLFQDIWPKLSSLNLF